MGLQVGMAQAEVVKIMGAPALSESYEGGWGREGEYPLLPDRDEERHGPVGEGKSAPLLSSSMGSSRAGETG